MRGIRWLPVLLFVLLDPLGLVGQPPTTMKDKDKDKKTEMAPSVNEVGGKNLQEWTRELTHADPSIREEALRAMPFFGKEACKPDILKLIMERTLDKDVSPRSRAILVLASLDVPKDHMVKVTKSICDRLVDDPQAGVKANAAMSLCVMADRANLDRDNPDRSLHVAIPYLVRGVSDPASWEIRRHCTYALAKLGRINDTDPAEPKCINGLLTAVKDHSFYVRLEAIKGFGEIGRTNESALAIAVERELVRLARDKDKVVSIWAWMSLMVVTETNAEAIQAIKALISDKEPRIKIAAISALGRLGDRARFAIPDLVKCLKDPELSVKGAAIITLAGIDMPGLETVNGIQAIADEKDGNDDMKRFAKMAVDHIKGVKKPDPIKK